jgi:hypothetical protein
MYRLRISRAAVSKVQVIILLLSIFVPPVAVTFFYVNGFFTSTLPLFSDNFDYGNMTTLNSIWAWTNSADVFPVTAVPTLSGSGFVTHDNSGVGSLSSLVYHSSGYSAKFTLTPTVDAWSVLYKDTLNRQFYSKLYMSNWVYFTSSPPSGQYLMLGPTLCGWHDNDLVAGYIYNDAGTLKWAMLNADNPNVDHTFAIANTGPAITNDTWYDIQVMVHADVANGEAAMWVNGIKVADVTGLTNNYDQGPNGEIGVRYLQVGPFEPWWNSQGFATTVYADDVRVSATYID